MNNYTLFKPSASCPLLPLQFLLGSVMRNNNSHAWLAIHDLSSADCEIYLIIEALFLTLKTQIIFQNTFIIN